MKRITYLLAVLLLLIGSMPSMADELTAQEIFEGMIYYENDQLESNTDYTDYHCRVVQTKETTGVRATESLEKDLYFMVPAYQLHMIGGTPAYYFDSDAIIITLESLDMERLRDATINDVDCYVIRGTPKDPAFARFNTTYYVAKDDFRHVRTVKLGSNDEYDSTTTVLDYTYGPEGPCNMVQNIVATTSTPDGNVIYTVNAVYSDYEYNIGLDVEFFLSAFEGEGQPNPIWN